MIRAILLLMVLVSMGCQRLEVDEPNLKETYYYNLDSLLDEQINYFIANKIGLEKLAIVDTDTAKNQYVPVDSTWQDELKIFRMGDLNKPVLRDLYAEEVVKDTSSNLSILRYTTDRDVSVRWFNVYFLNQIENVHRIEFLIEEDNPIYTSNRLMRLYFKQSDNVPLISSYAIKGSQKMLLKDEVNFFMEGHPSY